ncbi:maleylpyruvate isomerase family mycothiol-dependent enzyme [Mycobacterium sp. 1274761.0]|uniref:maleylpyruvate isomerase family mycothiol-dependent enzyme n=1 Tax=Mycobacterium sp. 1274761.0 TaxID=1834077 RepID=UPI001E3F8612|nr:maleylpyruvate isomerase family mycothiol-dependent enzyme [Mycobacterium sp. 1274761.0]
MTTAHPLRVAEIYQDTKDRIMELVGGLDDAGLNTSVPACPGWSVRDVVAHLAAVADDWAEGRLTGAPSDAQTADQVARFAGQDVTEIDAVWADAVARLTSRAANDGLEPPVGDIACHEHDIRAALGTPGARGSDAVHYSSDRLLANLRTPVPLRVKVEDAEYRSGPEGGRELSLFTTRFEALRWRTGRRSRNQLAAMDWSSDPAPVLDHLFLFGPAEADVVE